MAHSTSNTMFWLRHVGLAIAIIVIAVVVISLQQKREKVVPPEGKAPAKTVSQGMSDFYEDYRGSSTVPHQEDYGDFVVEVKPSDAPLENRLAQMESRQRSAPGRWVGEYKYRSFKAGSTLKEAITEYAQKEGMQVVWELEQDFIVKNHFQINDTLIGALHQISSAVDSNFEGEVKAYFCPKQRSLVITHQESDYLLANCILSRSGNS